MSLSSRLCATLILSSLLLCGQVLPVRAQVRVTDTFGRTLEGASIEFESLVSAKDVFRGFGSPATVGLPYGGRYRLTARAPRAESSSRIVWVFDGVLLTVGLPIVPLSDVRSYSTLEGTIENYGGSYRDLRIRLIPYFGADISEIQSNGTSFRFPTVDQGAYLLMILADHDGSRVLYSRSIVIQWQEDKSMRIDLAGKSGEPIDSFVQ
jgi:hypothetical protein